VNDIEIANSVELDKIENIAKKIDISEEELECYGKYKAKINYSVYEKKKDDKDGKLILVTAINPTPLGEGKTTTAIGLADGLQAIGKKSIVLLREPSLGPVFGLKGGATGGGFSQVAPMEDINLHFTGDIHAITTANNLLSAIIDNHIFQGNALDIKTVTWKRCVDLNDRQLRKVNTGLSGEKNMEPRMDGFDITVASEIMAVFCLAENLQDLKRRIGNIIIGYNSLEEPIKVKDLKAEGSLTVLLKDAFNPNLVQTLEHTPGIIHGGPFANIAHGCNSLIATKMALKLADYVVTEAGFGADLGAEKFLDIKCRKLGKAPDAVVCVATIKALKYHGGAKKEEIENENLVALENGIHNLLKHIDNIKNKFKLNVIVAINKFNYDTKKEINFLEEVLNKNNIQISLVESWGQGSKGAKDLARKVVSLTDLNNNFNYIYELHDSIEEKIRKVCVEIYGAEGIKCSENVKNKIEKIKKLGYEKLPICIAKTPFSFSDDPKNLECKEPFYIHINDIEIKAGAEFIVVYTRKSVNYARTSKKTYC
jgi:formate--tetrahydrofolate ligase